MLHAGRPSYLFCRHFARSGFLLHLPCSYDEAESFYSGGFLIGLRGADSNKPERIVHAAADWHANTPGDLLRIRVELGLDTSQIWDPATSLSVIDAAVFSEKIRDWPQQ